MIYLDNAATTACSEEVIAAMLPYFREAYGNASSIDHVFGVTARRAVDEAREHVAALVGAKPEDVIFTSGSTEANNLALSVEHRVLTTPVEHPSILDPYLARRRPEDAMLEIDAFGRVTAEALRTSPSTDPSTLAVIATNNETGVEQDIESLSDAVNGSSSMIHLDATQALLTRTLSVNAKSGIDSVSLSAHKIYGPKGVGALVATSRARRTLRPYAHGGGHERGLRSGTLNVPGIVGFGKAAELARKNGAKHREQFARLRSTFLDAIRDELADSYALTIPDEYSSPHILSLRIIDVNSRALLAAVNQDIAFSLGSACATNKTEPSHVLTALGLSRSAIAQTFRISFSSDQAKRDVVSAAQLIATAAQRLRKYALGRSA